MKNKQDDIPFSVTLSLRELLEGVCIKPDPSQHVNGRTPCSRTDTGPSATDDDLSDSENPPPGSKSNYRYSNEEEYLFDQVFGAAGSPAEERTDLAVALMRTLDVGPMADALFYDEMAICFLRCRERYNMRIWKDQLIEGGKLGEPKANGEEQKRRNSSRSRSKHIKKIGFRSSILSVDSDYHLHDDEKEDDSSDSDPLNEWIRNINVNNGNEDSGSDMKTEKDSCDGNEEKWTNSSQDEKDAGPEEDEDSSISFKKHPPSVVTSEGLKCDNVDEMSTTSQFAWSDDFERVDHVAQMNMLSNAEKSLSFGSGDSDDDDVLLEAIRTARSSMFTNTNGVEYSFRTQSSAELNGLFMGEEKEIFNDDEAVGLEQMEEDSFMGIKTNTQWYDEHKTVDGSRPNFRSPREGDLSNSGKLPKSDVSDDDTNISIHLIGTFDSHAPNAIPVKKIYQKRMSEAYIKLEDENDPPCQRRFSDMNGFREDIKTEKLKSTQYSSKIRQYPMPPPPPPKPTRSVNQGKPLRDFCELEDSLHGLNEPTSPSDDQLGMSKRKKVALLRDEGRSCYINGAYRESVIRYTEAVKIHTENFNSSYDSSNDSTLGSLYCNRAAALMMSGVYTACVVDCDRALQCTANDSNPGCIELGPTFRIKIFCRKARAFLKAGNVRDAEKSFRSAAQAADHALILPNRAAKITDEAKIIQCQANITLGLSDVKQFRDALDGATMSSVENASSDVDLEVERRRSVQVLVFLNAALSVAPGCMELHQRKVGTLATLKRWAELGNHCERLAADMVKMDGLFRGDLATLNPFPDVSQAKGLKPDYFEKNVGDLADQPSLRMLSSEAVRDAVLRLPCGVLPTYLRSLRLEERYAEATCAAASIEAHMSKSNTRRGIVSMTCLANERDKLRQTMSLKEKGDALFRCDDYERAASTYYQCMNIDSEMSKHNSDSVDNDDAGGRLHAVLHCNRAACLMSLKKYEEALKECTSALRIHKYYMKAMLRRGRCFAQLRQYDESVSEYKRYIGLVREAKRSPQSAIDSNAACTFDRPNDVTPSEYSKVKLELEDVKKIMKRATVNARGRKEKKMGNQQGNFHRAASATAVPRHIPETRGRSKSRNETKTGNHQGYNKKYHRAASDTGATRHNIPETRGRSKDASKACKRQSEGSGRAPSQKHTKEKIPNIPTTCGAGPPPGPSRKQQPERPLSVAPNKNELCHYQVLEVNVMASGAEIKKAYYKLALKYHPDKNSDEGAAEVFRRVKLAYEVLGSVGSKLAYDSSIHHSDARRQPS